MNSRDKIEQHLIAQQAQAAHKVAGEWGVRCMYRAPSGLMCAAGCLIPEDKYDASMESRGATYVAKNFPGSFPADISIDEVYEWQLYHDTAYHNDSSVFSYKEWLNGASQQSPTLFKEEMNKKYGAIA